MQHKLENRHELLDNNGHLIEAGWANSFILDYNRETVEKKGMALKEWEYYLAIKRNKYAAAITAVVAGDARVITVHLMDFEAGKFICTSVPYMVAKGVQEMPLGVFSNYATECDSASLNYCYGNGIGHISASLANFENDKPVKVAFDIELPKKDLTVITVPYSNPELFYYNCKANCMPTQGFLEFDGKRYEFGMEDSMATYDWGRGIWEPVNQWYWGSAGTMLNGVPFGFNIGHGFGDTSNATENMIFYDGVCHKFDEIKFCIPDDKIGDLKHEIPADSYLKPWKFVTNDGRLNMTFTPVMDRNSGVENLNGYPAGQHQIFGYYSGVAVLDDGTQLPFENVLGFAEKVVNVW